MVDGRKKGAAFENEVCRALSIWLCPPPGEGRKSWDTLPVSALPFRRRFTDTTPLDGHWEGSGDILHRPGIVCMFSVECKAQQGWELDGALHNKHWPVWKWWYQTCTQARRAEKEPLLFFTRNRRPIYAMLNRRIAGLLGLYANRVGAVMDVMLPAAEHYVTICSLKTLVRVCPSQVRALYT